MYFVFANPAKKLTQGRADNLVIDSLCVLGVCVLLFYWRAGERIYICDVSGQLAYAVTNINPPRIKVVTGLPRGSNTACRRARPSRPYRLAAHHHEIMPGMGVTSAVLSPLKDPETGPVPLFSPQLSTTSVNNWPISFTEPSDRSSISPPIWPAMPDSFARWPAKGPATDTISKFPSQLDFRVELADGQAKCVLCTNKLCKGSPQVSMRRNSGFRLTGFRCVTCVQPHTLRQAGGSEAVTLDEVRRPRSPSPLPSALSMHLVPSVRGAAHRHSSTGRTSAGAP